MWAGQQNLRVGVWPIDVQEQHIRVGKFQAVRLDQSAEVLVIGRSRAPSASASTQWGCRQTPVRGDGQMKCYHQVIPQHSPPDPPAEPLANGGGPPLIMVMIASAADGDHTLQGTVDLAPRFRG